MKKSKKIIIGVLCIIILLVTTGCTKKVAISSEEFKTNLVELGFTVQDATSQMSSYDYIEKVYIAMSSDLEYQIEFYKLSDVDSAVSFYNHNKSIFENSKSSTSINTSVNMSNYAKYSLETNGKYKVVSRIEDTLIYLNVNSKYKETVKQLIENLGY